MSANQAVVVVWYNVGDLVALYVVLEAVLLLRRINWLWEMI